ncbi:MAG: adenylate/guanylate cyclase domain-containing protein [Deltaproteobacteria bacterium]|nr:adenylate/guanylate cyclase domain-containing protein [Deltaproteobacteria bacterium]
MSTTYRLHPLTKVLIGLSVVTLSVGFCFSPWGKALEHFSGDTLYYLRGSLDTPLDIVVVAIDEPSFGVIRQQWPWPRGLHARLIEGLFAAGAKIVAFDVIFAEPSTADQDRLLREALERHPNVVLAGDLNTVFEKNYTQVIFVGPHRNVSPPGTPVGFTNLPLDSDGFVRRIRLNQGGLRAISLLSAQLFCRNHPCRDLAKAQGQHPDTDLEINYLGPARTVRTVSYYQALEPSKYLPTNCFKDKMVWIGLSLGSAILGKSEGQEKFPVPFTRWDGGYMAGVEIHAQAAHSLMHNIVIRSLPYPWTLILSLLVGSASVFVFFNLKPASASFLWLLGCTVFLGTSLAIFTHRFVFVPVTSILLPFTFSYLVSPFLHYWQVWRERNFIRKAFSTYLAPPVVDQLLAHPEQLTLGGELVEATVLFLDLAGFTTLSEHIRPEALIQLLNRYLGRFSDVVFRWNGLIDKFIGDAVMAAWGVPVSQPDHAERACFAALEMVAELQKLTRQDRELGTDRQLQIRIGINSGKMVAGNVGGQKRFNFTVVGDEVNLASRLEGINRVYGTVIMIGPNTAELVKHTFELRELDLVRVKGKSNAVQIYELQQKKGNLSEIQRQVNELFVKGRRCLIQRDWRSARNCFERGLSLQTKDGPCQLYIARCLQFEKNPPDPEWDCTVSLEK